MKMKSASAFIFAFFLLSLWGCQDSRSDLTKSEDNLLFKEVGEEISMEAAKRWMELYKKQNPSGRLLGSFTVDAANLESTLESATDVIGLAFHYGIDDDGVTHLIVIPIGSSRTLWSIGDQRTFIDANNNSIIDQNEAREWASRFEVQNPSAIWFHFFGRAIFDEIKTVEYFSSLDIQPAIHDVELTPELLLIVWNEQLVTNGRSMDEGRSFDASNPCPPCSIQ
jgi:hypothetical protein